MSLEDISKRLTEIKDEKRKLDEVFNSKLRYVEQQKAELAAREETDLVRKPAPLTWARSTGLVDDEVEPEADVGVDREWRR